MRGHMLFAAFMAIAAAGTGVLNASQSEARTAPGRHTVVGIRADEFTINGQPTYKGRTWRGMKIQGLLLNSRMVQATFDDENQETVANWRYPDTGKWDPERNTREFLAAMPLWRKHGLLAFTVNFQGGNPRGYSDSQPWRNSAFRPDGSLKPAYLKRMARVIDRADELGMVVILGIFYFGQDQVLKDEAAVRAGLDNAVRWVIGRGYRNVLIEVDNECDVSDYDHEILKPKRVPELIRRVKELGEEAHHPLLAGVSFGGGAIPTPEVVAASDFVLVHGNGVSNPDRIARMVDQIRALPTYRPMPILFNEDDHFDFDKPRNNFVAALSRYASWGFFDPGKSNYVDGYQSVPPNWGINTERKRAFFGLLAEITGARP